MRNENECGCGVGARVVCPAGKHHYLCRWARGIRTRDSLSMLLFAHRAARFGTAPRRGSTSFAHGRRSIGHNLAALASNSSTSMQNRQCRRRAGRRGHGQEDGERSPGTGTSPAWARQRRLVEAYTLHHLRRYHIQLYSILYTGIRRSSGPSYDSTEH